MVVRGCGTREPGGIYAFVPTGRNGRPLEAFLIDPPLIIPDDLGMTDVGVTLIPDPEEARTAASWDDVETWHILDIVGANNYPNVADVLEEGRQFGFSRRLSSSLEFHKLGPKSRLILGHSRAHINNAIDYREVMHEEGRSDGDCPACPRHIIGHGEYDTADMCAGLFWQDLDPATVSSEGLDKKVSRIAVRELPSAAYTACERPEGITPQYQTALFINLPLRRLQVINDPEGGKHVSNAAKAAKSGLSVTFADE